MKSLANRILSLLKMTSKKRQKISNEAIQLKKLNEIQDKLQVNLSPEEYIEVDTQVPTFEVPDTQ